LGLSTAIRRGFTAAVGVAIGSMLLAAPRMVVGEAPSAAWPAAAFGGWRDDSGQPFDLRSAAGGLAIVTMAYTHCRLVCPMVFERLQQMQQELDSRGQSGQFFVIGFAGVGDDPQAWHQYRISRHLTRANWHFLSAGETDTRRFARTFGFEYWRYDEHVMHGFQIFVFGADGTRRTQITMEDGPWQDPGS
jgi:cytochrome oxidase Cu insertion factor (SCO1/SenC/PrrC family)